MEYEFQEYDDEELKRQDRMNKMIDGLEDYDIDELRYDHVVLQTNMEVLEEELRQTKEELASGSTVESLFELQRQFMEMLLDRDKLPEWPINLSTKHGQRVIKEIMFNTIMELAEASFTLKNKQHRITDDRDFDRDHYVEEFCDAAAFFIEALILSGITSKEFVEQFKKKNAIVKERLLKGY